MLPQHTPFNIIRASGGYASLLSLIVLRLSPSLETPEMYRAGSSCKLPFFILFQLIYERGSAAASTSALNIYIIYLHFTQMTDATSMV